MFPEAGERLGPYEILGGLGGGGMARVYRAWDGRLHREVAIKVIDDRMAMPDIGERFLREARAASALNHPNICTIFDIGEQDGAPYLVMELLEGETLRERISEETLSVEQILRYSAEVADALAAAHERGIVHRDVKPANIFLMRRPNGSHQTKVLDFGLAQIERFADEERDFVGSNLTTMGATVGTVAYMSPEQARGEKLDARSDLFSLGIVMYEMATGQLPFRGNTSALVFVQLLGQMAPEPIRRLNGEIPAELEQVIMKLLAKSARARYQSATELVDELQELAEQRSGWLTRMKTPPPVDSTRTPPGDAGARHFADARYADAARGRSIPEELPPEYGDRAFPMRVPRVPNAGGVRAGGGRQRDAAPPSWPQRRGELYPGNGQMPPTMDGMAGRASEMRPVRTSIASNPKVSYPSEAPYLGQSGMMRAAGGAGVKVAESSGAIPVQRREADAENGVSGFSGLRAVMRDPRPSGTRAATGRHSEAGRVVGPELDEGKGIAWQLIALVIAVLALVGGFVAWKLGWLGGAVPLKGSLVLLSPINLARARPLLRRR